MHILLHDFAGHPFQVELSRALAARGHRVTHGWFAADAGPKGVMKRQNGDAEGLEFQPFGVNISYSKTNFRKRRSGDLSYAREVGLWVKMHRPDIIISGNTPTEVQEIIIRAARKADAAFVYWCQDFYSIAASQLLKKKLPIIGHIVGAYYRSLERRQMRRAARIVHITEAFYYQTDAWGIARDRIEVIPNWGAIAEIKMLERDTFWREEQGLHRPRVALYSGTLAMKHNPMLLRALAEAVESRGDTSVVVIAAGVGADALEKGQLKTPLSALELRGLQPFDRFAEVLATADVLMAVLEREAGTFSVPSKILSYLCAGRPIVLAAPLENLAAKIVQDVGAGVVVEPEDEAGFVASVVGFLNDSTAAARAGARARAYAVENFAIDRVADRFERVCLCALQQKW